MILIKSEKQINGIRKSCKALAHLFQKLQPIVQVGISTKEIDRFCVDYIKKIGGVPAWYSQNFDGAVCASINDEVIHGLPSSRIIQDGDLVSLDIGIDLNGYISDSAVTFPVGNVAPEHLQLLKVTDECLHKGIEACCAGNRIADIARAVYSHARQFNYGVVYSYCGHGVGLKVHEPPDIPNDPRYVRYNRRLKAGMVVAIEPMINLGTADVFEKQDGWTVVTADGSVSCHMEHTVAIFDDHTEILTTL